MVPIVLMIIGACMYGWPCVFSEIKASAWIQCNVSIV